MSARSIGPENPVDGHPDAPPPRPVLVTILALLLLLEALAVLGVGVFLLAELVTTSADSVPTALALIVLVLAAGLWVVFIALGMFRLRPWTRGAGLTWQIIVVVIAICCFQGIFGDPSTGWQILVPGVLGIALLLSPPVVAATRRV